MKLDQNIDVHNFWRLIIRRISQWIVSNENSRDPKSHTKVAKQ